MRTPGIWSGGGESKGRVLTMVAEEGTAWLWDVDTGMVYAGRRARMV